MQQVADLDLTEEPVLSITAPCGISESVMERTRAFVLFLLFCKTRALSSPARDQIQSHSLKRESEDLRIRFLNIKAFEIILERKLELDVFFFLYKFGAVGCAGGGER